MDIHTIRRQLRRMSICEIPLLRTFNAPGELSDQEFLAMNCQCSRERDAARYMIHKEFADKYIGRIFAAVEDDGSIRLQIKIFTGETTDKYLFKLRGRTCCTFKEIVEAHGGTITAQSAYEQILFTIRLPACEAA